MIATRTNGSFRALLAVPLMLMFMAEVACSQGIRHITPPAVKPAPRPDAYVSMTFRKWSADSVFKTIKKRGLEAEQVTEGLIVGPPGSKDNIIFITPSYGERTGGLIAGFDTEQELMDAWVYLLRMNLNRKRPAWRIYRRDNILLLISGLIPEDQAVRYRNALDEMQAE
jgi:hypothetical protein